MFQVDDGAIADAGKHVVALVGSTHSLQQRLVSRVVTRSTQKARHGSSGTRAVGDDALSRAKHLLVEQPQVAHGSLQVEQCGRGTPGVDGCPVLFYGRVSSACPRYSHHIALQQGAPRCIGSLRLGSGGSHVASHVRT